MPSPPPHAHGGSHHDWHSSNYVGDWIARDVTRDDERRPRLAKMVAAAPFRPTETIDVLDVGGGYGIVTEEVLKAFPAARVVWQDYSRPMLQEARARLGDGDGDGGRVRYVLCDLFDPDWTKAVGGPFDVAVSAIAIHNLGQRDAIFACYRAIAGLLKPGGVFLNYDRFPGGIESHDAALRDVGFAAAKPLWQEPPLAILVAGPKI
jgi:ubiquinone/menaquinone biosynthesis C-methylase UbiE